jgi:glycerophosphoryl diester phosphodiesterase
MPARPPLAMALGAASLLALAPGLRGEGAAAPFEIAHRGASGYLPEHTLEAVAMAHGLGAAYIEQDVVISSDGVPVVLHDLTLDATTDVVARFPGRARPDGKHYALDFSLAELKQLEVRERFKPETGARVYPGRYAGGRPIFRIATLEESLALVAGLNASTGREAGVYPEVKRPAWHLAQGVDLSVVVLEVLGRFGYGEKDSACYLQCFEYDEVRRIRSELGYRGRLVQLLGGGDKVGEGNTDNAHLRSPEGLRELAAWADGIGPPLGEVVKGSSPADRSITSLVADARAAGLLVHPYTARADDLPKWAASYGELVAALREAGVEGFFTDFPGLAR